MDGFTYMDMFATKGVEYLLVIGFLVLFVFVGRLLAAPSGEAAAIAAGNENMPLPGWFEVPGHLHYHRGHAWARPDGSQALVGMDDFAQKLVGTPREVRLPAVGSRLEQGSPGWSLAFDGASIDMLSPVDGEVLEVNEQVLVDPGLVNRSCYEKGWLLKVKPSKLEANLSNLLSGRLVHAWMRDSLDYLRAEMQTELGPVAQDGGVPAPGLARNLNSRKWEQLARKCFLV